MNPNEQLNELALFAGAGGGILGGKLLGWRTICAVEWEPYPACVLAARQNDGILAPFPIWDNVRTFDGRPWRGRVDVVSGGFPCQDISCAGKGAGIDGERSGMWVEMARIIREVAPRYVFVENSPMLTSRGLGRVLGDLAEMGFNARWGVLGACDVGAPHKRDRIWILASYAKVSRCKENEHIGNESKIAMLGGNGHVSDSDGERSSARIPKPPQRQEGIAGELDDDDPGRTGESSWWLTEPDVGRVAHGVASRVDRLKAIGNGQVPAVAALAFQLLSTNQETK
jgi:DNA (cytosine-5)-methyltransferase 1